MFDLVSQRFLRATANFSATVNASMKASTLGLALVSAVAALSNTDAVVAMPQDVAEPATAPFASPASGDNGDAFLGRIQVGWTPPLDLTDLLWYEVMRVNLRDLTVTAMSIPTTALGPPAPIVCDLLDMDGSVAPNAEWPLPANRLPPVEAGEDPYPTPYDPGAGPNDETNYFLPPLVAAPPFGTVWNDPGIPLELTAYRYYIRAVYDTNDDAPDPRFIASAWIEADGWRKVVMDLTPPPPVGPDVAGFEAVPGSGFWVTVPTTDAFGAPTPQNFYPFPNPVSDPGVDGPSLVVALTPPDGPAVGDQLGCPLVGNRLRWSDTPTTRKATPDDPAGPPPFDCEYPADVDARDDIDAFPNGAGVGIVQATNLDGTLRFQFNFMGGGPSLNTGDPVTLTFAGAAAPLVSGTEYFAVVEDIDSFSLALTQADALEFIVIGPSAPAAVTAEIGSCSFTPGVGFPWRWRVQRGYVSSFATAEDLPPENIATVYESPETNLPDWAGLGTIQTTDDQPRTFLYDDLFDAPLPPYCQLYYWYGVSRFVGLDAFGLHEVESEQAIAVVDQNGAPILPIGHYLCSSVNIDASGVVGNNAFDDCTTVNPCEPAGTGACLADRVRLAWDTDGQFVYSNYKIYRGVCLDGVQSAMELYVTVPGTSRVFNDFNVASNQIYNYSIQGFTPFSGSSQPTPIEMGFRLTAPNVTAASDGTSTTGITVTWTSAPGWAEDTISIWRKQSGQAWPTTPLAAATNLPASQTTFVDTTAVAGVVYVYAATAHSDSLDANSMRGATNNGYLQLGAPTSVAATSNLAQYVKVTWLAPGSSLTYEVSRRKLGTSKFTVMSNTANLFYLDITATPTQIYEYRVRAKMSNGIFSPYSATVQGVRPTDSPG